MVRTQYEGRLFINGQFVEAESGKTFPLLSALDPEGAPICQVSSAGPSDVDRAVAAGKAAQLKWEAMSASDRGDVLLKFANLIVANGEAIKMLDTVAMGRPLSDQFIDISVAAKKFQLMAGLGNYVAGNTSLNTPGTIAMSLKQPYGVVAGIMWANKVAPAVAAGNAIIVKTSEKAPLSGAFLASLSVEAGFPAGLIQNLSGAGESGKLLAEHMQIRAISFTGSTRTGRFVQQAAAMSNLKHVALELGGKSPTVIFDDADLDVAIPACHFSLRWNSGQICMANTRLYVQEGIYESFVEAFKRSFGGVTLGDPREPETQMGPLADKIQGENVLRYIEIGKKEGRLAMGGSRVAGKPGYAIEPTIFTDVPDSATISREEIFGPVLLINKFKTEEEAIRRANDTEYGLYAAVFSKDIDRCLRVARSLEAGSIGVNATSPTLAADMEFGGYKASGVGRESGHQALEAWLETKSVYIKVSGM